MPPLMNTEKHMGPGNISSGTTGFGPKIRSGCSKLWVATNGAGKARIPTRTGANFTVRCGDSEYEGPGVDFGPGDTKLFFWGGLLFDEIRVARKIVGKSKIEKSKNVEFCLSLGPKPAPGPSYSESPHLTIRFAPGLVRILALPALFVAIQSFEHPNFGTSARWSNY